MLRIPETDKNQPVQVQIDKLIEYLRQLVFQLEFELDELRKEKDK